MSTYMQPDIGLSGIFDVVAENSLKQKDPFPFAGMWLFSGAQGSGKTLLMMHMVKQIHEQCPECLIVSNIAIYGIPSIPYKGIKDFEKYNNGAKGIVFVIDEIHTLFNSLESAKMPLSTVTVWCQNRKNRRLILGTSQIFKRVAKPVREQATWNYSCRKVINPFLYSYAVYDGSMYDENGKYDDAEPRRNFYVPKVSVMRMYNTLEVVKRDGNSH